ncbi:MAG TPA: acetylglutamate kinase [Stellaceae bacterium]|jgi:acetylglutamate kinase|nr:acetylglutamate kinase [Stellaceae bacterium]
MNTAPADSAASASFRDPAVIAAVLAEAVPYLARYDGRTIVIKYGGHAMGVGGETFSRDIVLLRQVGINPVVVHGGGPQINRMLDRLGIKSNFVNGLRVTDSETMEVVEMVLAGTINKQLVASINHAGGCSIGLSGKDGNLIRARKLTRNGELGFVGEPERVDGSVLHRFEQTRMIPVIAPVGVGVGGETYNINADTVAGAVAAAVKAARFLLLTDVPGVLDADKRLIPELTAAEARRLIADGTISGGMIPKVETCLDAVEGGVEAAVILDGRVPHAILLELFTNGAGTLIRRG